MADETYEIGFEATGASETAQKVGRVTEAGNRMASAWGDVRSAGLAGAASLGATIGVYTAAAAAAVRFSQELERQAGIFNRFSGNIEQVRARTNGLVSDLEAMRVANELAARGINLTASDLANVVVASYETAASQGRDFTQVVQQMTEALGSGSAEAFQRFGISVESGVDKSEAFQQALEQLRDAYGDVESSADTFGGRLDQLSAAYENAKTRTFEVVAQSRVLENTFTDLFNAVTGGTATFEQAMDRMLSGVVVFASGATLALQQYMRWATTVVRAQRALADGELELAQNLWAQAGAIQAEQTESFFNGGFAAQTQFNADRAMEGISSRRGGGPERSTTTARGGGSRSRGSASESGLSKEEQFEKERRVRELEAERAHAEALNEIEEQLGENRRARQLARLEAENAAAEERERKEQAQLDRQKQRMVEQAEAEKAMLQERAQLWRNIGGQMVQQGMQPVTAAAGEMFRFLVQGSDLSGDAFVAMLDSFLESTAIQYTIKALAEAAEAVAAAARYDYAAAAQHGVAAALAGAVATATGVASAAIQSPSASSAAGGGNAPVPVGSSGGAVGGGGTTQNVTIQLYAPQSIMTKAEQGQMLERIARETTRAMGGTGRS